MPRNKFTTCAKCGKETSKTGNYTNMILSGINKPEEYDNQYGMMCAEHAEEITNKILSEKNLTESDLKNAYENAMKIMNNELDNIKSNNSNQNTHSLVSTSETDKDWEYEEYLKINRREKKQARIKAIITIAILIPIGLWFYSNRERNEYFQGIPEQFCGTWNIIKNDSIPFNGILQYIFSEERLIERRIWEKELFTGNTDYVEKEERVFKISRVALNYRKNKETGSLYVDYYSEKSKEIFGHDIIQRIEINYGKRNIIHVTEIIPTGYNDETRCFEVGDYKKIH